MSAKNYIDSLRARPETIRKQIAFWASLGITVVIFLFWLASMTGVTSKASNAVAGVVEKAGSPAQSLVASIGGVFVDIKDMIFTPKKVTYSNIEVRAGN